MSTLDELPGVIRLLEQICTRMGNGRVTPVDEDEAAWVGAAYEQPLQIRVDAVREVEVSATGRFSHGTFVLMWDPEAVPVPNGPPPRPDRDLARVFVGRGTFLMAKPAMIDAHVAAFRALPEQLTSPIVDAMPRSLVRSVKVHPDGVDTTFSELLPALTEPVERIVLFAQLVGWAAAGLRKVPPTAAAVAAGASGTAATERHRCGYCHVLVFLGSRHACPNCGGPIAA